MGDGVIIIWSRWKHQRYVKIRGLTIDCEEESWESWNKYFSLFKKTFICMFPSKSFVFEPWHSQWQAYQLCGKEGKLMGQNPGQGQTGNHRFPVSMRKCLPLYDYFFKIGGWCVACYVILWHCKWLLCCYVVLENMY